MSIISVIINAIIVIIVATTIVMITIDALLRLTLCGRNRNTLQAQLQSSQRHPRHSPVALRKSEVCWSRRNFCKFVCQSQARAIFLRSIDKDGWMIILVGLVHHPSGQFPLG